MLSLAIAAGILVAPTESDAGALRVAGCGTAAAGMRLLSQAFHELQPSTRIVIIPGLGSTGAVRALLAGSIQIALSSRQPTPEEAAAGARSIPYARTPLVFVTQDHRGVADVTSDRLAAIYRGESIDWPDGTHLRLVLRPASASDTRLIRALSPAMSDAVESALARQGMLTALNDEENADLLESIDGSFGAIGLAQLVVEGRSLRPMALDGVAPTAGAMARGLYPLVKHLFFVVLAASPAEALKFIEFATSPQARTLLANSGFWPPEHSED